MYIYIYIVLRKKRTITYTYIHTNTYMRTYTCTHLSQLPHLCSRNCLDKETYNTHIQTCTHAHAHTFLSFLASAAGIVLIKKRWSLDVKNLCVLSLPCNVCVCMYECIYVFMYVCCMYVCIWLWVCLCAIIPFVVCVCMHACITYHTYMHTYMLACIHRYIHTARIAYHTCKLA
jgi:hypothetical protein